LLGLAGGLPVTRAPALVVAVLFLSSSAAAQPRRPAAAGSAAAPKRPAATGPRHRIVVAPLATLGSESKAADVKAAQKLVARGLGSLDSVDLVTDAAMLDAVKRAKRPELRSCDGELPCLVALGQLVGADYTVFGEVGGLGSAQVIYLKLIDVTAAREVRSTVLELDGTRAADDESRAAATRLFAPARYVGELVLASNVKGASIYVDGELVARTPARPIALPVGSHALRVTHPEFRDFVRFVEIGFADRAPVDVRLVPYDAVSGDIRRTGRDPDAGFGPGGEQPLPWYRRWYTIAGGAAIVVLTSALVVGLAADGIDFDREREVP
jgi:hypothetical protein